MSAESSQSIHFLHDLAPRISGAPGDVTVECDQVPPVPELSAVDDCDPDPFLAFAETRIDGDCPNEYRLIRDWEAVDACGNSARHSQVIDVVDSGAPVLVSEVETACLWPPNHWASS